MNFKNISSNSPLTQRKGSEKIIQGEWYSLVLLELGKLFWRKLSQVWLGFISSRKDYQLLTSWSRWSENQVAWLKI